MTQMVIGFDLARPGGDISIVALRDGDRIVFLTGDQIAEARRALSPKDFEELAGRILARS